MAKTDQQKMHDKTLPLNDRKAAFKRVQNAMLNPKKAQDFNPETFDPMEDHPDTELGKRIRKIPPTRLPTMGMKPKEILEGQMVGMFESKQDLYLMIAHVNNTLLDRIEQLETQVASLLIQQNN